MPSPAILLLVASPELCRPYGTAFAQSLVTTLWLKGYTLCLNADEVPAIPTEWQKALDLVQRPKVTGEEVVGEELGQLAQLCKAHHPRSFDPLTLTYLSPSRGKWVRVPCERK